MKFDFENIDEPKLTASQLKQVQRHLELSDEELARLLGLSWDGKAGEGARSVRKMKSGERVIGTTMVCALWFACDFDREWPAWAED